MDSVFQAKQGTVIDAPVLLIKVELRSNQTFYWGTERLVVDGQAFEPRIQRHNAHEVKLGSEESVDAIHRLAITVANTDGLVADVERTIGWKGAKVEVRLAFFDLQTGTRTSEFVTIFKGRANAPETITESLARLSFTNRLSLTRVLLPDTRIQKRCPWRFPATLSERESAAIQSDVPTPLQRCGYSADLVTGIGNLNGGQVYTSCDYTALGCRQRGMYDKDSAGRDTRRFGGLQFLPPQVSVRGNGERNSQLSNVIDNEAKYNDFVPLVYGTCWLRPPVIMGRNDGNLTRMEVLLGSGPISDVRRVVVNGIEVPQGRAGANMTSTGWWNPVSDGSRTGAFNLDFRDSAGTPVGDPHGSLATLSIVVPNRVADGSSVPKISVLVDGMRVQRYSLTGTTVGTSFTANPAWVMLDLLRRSGWAESELNLESFAKSAEYCDQLTAGLDQNGNPSSSVRAGCHVAITKRRSAAELLRGIRMGAGLMLSYDEAGKLELRVETKIGDQHPTKPPGSNATAAIAGGWPAFEFGDGSDGRSDIAILDGGASSFRLWSRGSAETANRLSVDFVNSQNEYQQDGVSLADFKDVENTGQELSAALPAVGVSSLPQAIRALRLHLKKSVEGNLYATFRTGVRGIGLRPGDLITISYARHGLNRDLFRILSIAPDDNYRGMEITAQVHRESWYLDAAGDWDGVSTQQPDSRNSLARALADPVTAVEKGGSGDSRELEVSFATPVKSNGTFSGIPTLALVPDVVAGSPGLAAGRRWFYAISAIGSTNEETSLSSTVRADLPDTAGTYQVRLKNISAPAGTTRIRVYRGEDPLRLVRIAEVNLPVTEFLDSGLAAGTQAPPDPNFDHVNVHWRWLMTPLTSVAAASATAIIASGLNLSPDAHVNEVVMLVSGPGAGQQRKIVANSATEITVDTAWNPLPTSETQFVIAEASWRPGATAESSPARFSVPWRGASWLQIQARAANVANLEADASLSPNVAIRLSANGDSGGDQVAPPQPSFALSTRQDGSFEISNLGFGTLNDVEGVERGLVKIWHVPELFLPSERFLTAPLNATGTTVALSESAVVGELLQVESEILKVTGIVGGGQYSVERAQLGSAASSHDENTLTFPIVEKSFTLAFTRGLFGTPAGANWSETVDLPQARIVAAELTVENGFGASEPRLESFTQTLDYGLRTMQGRQASLQLSGYLSVAADALPRLELDREVVVRDVVARVVEAPTGAAVHVRLLTGSLEYCDLVIPAGARQSNVVDGWNRQPLTAGTLVGLSVVGVGNYALGNPGRDLTVTVRF